MLKSLCLALHLCSTLAGPAWAYDGDTINVQGVAVRIWGLDAEELNEPHGLAAKWAMIRLIDASDVSCKLNGERSYKRYVGTCYVNGLDVAEAMTRQGFALDCAHYSGGFYRGFEPAGAREKLIQKPYC